MEQPPVKNLWPKEKNFFSKIIAKIKNLWPIDTKRQIKEHFIAATMVNFALAMVVLFEPIYLYQVGYSLQEIAFFYLITYSLFFFLMPLGAHFAAQKGEEPGIFVGSALYIIFYISLFFITHHPWLFYISAIIYAFQKTYYWPAYHGNFAKFSQDAGEGKEISLLTAASSLVYIIGPVLAGFIIHQWGYGVLFTVVSFLFLTSNIATLATKEKINSVNFPYLDTYKDLFSKRNRRSLLAYIGFGEELIVLVVWPVFISIIVADALNIGFIVTLATLVTTMAVIYIGKLADSKNRRRILSVGSIFYSLAWFFRMFISTGFGVFFVDVMSRLGKNIINIPLMAITYDRAKKSERFYSSSVMKGVVFFEMSLVVGKVVALLSIYVMLFFIGDQVMAFKAIFILAGSMTLLYRLI